MTTDKVVPPAIVASAGVQGLAVTRGLGERGVPVVVLHWDDDDLASVSRYAVEAIKVPPPDTDGKGFIEHLLALGDRFAGAVVMPTTDGAAKDVACHKEELERWFRVEGPSWEVAERYIDKRYTYEIAAALGIAIPRTLIPTSAGDLDSYVGQVMFPCIVKPRQSHLWAARFGGKLAVVNSMSEMRTSYDAARAAGLDVVIQELIPGPDRYGVNYNAYRTASGVVAECTARKLRQGPPGSGLPRVVLGAHVPEIVEPGRALLAGLDYEGFACVEFKFDDRDGRYKLLEVNGRHNLSSLLSIRSGINFPWISYRYLVAREVPPQVQPLLGLFWINEWLDLSQNRTRAGRDGCSVRELLRPYVRQHVYATLDRSDPGPSRLLARAVAQDTARVMRREVRALLR